MPLTFIRKLGLAAVAAVTLTLLTTLWNGIASAQTLLPAQDYPRSWDREFPLGDFSRSIVDYGEILSGGPPRDGIPAIDAPKFVSIAEAAERYAPTEPVIGLEVNGEARAYPLQVLTWHEIANDVIGGVPVAVTYCPLCNAAIVFDTRVNGAAHSFGVSGRLRKSDMIMYDRETESWWQQFSGEALVGDHVGQKLTKLPSRIESFERFTARFPQGEVLVPTREGQRPYGRNPYRSYDAENGLPFLYRGDLPEGIPPMARVIIVEGFEDRAYAMSLIAERGTLRDGPIELSWTAGQNSALDTSDIAEGRDVGNIVVQTVDASGARSDAVHDITFAFVYTAFIDDGTIIQ